MAKISTLQHIYIYIYVCVCACVCVSFCSHIPSAGFGSNQQGRSGKTRPQLHLQNEPRQLQKEERNPGQSHRASLPLSLLLSPIMPYVPGPPTIASPLLVPTHILLSIIFLRIYTSSSCFCSRSCPSVRGAASQQPAQRKLERASENSGWLAEGS